MQTKHNADRVDEILDMYQWRMSQARYNKSKKIRSSEQVMTDIGESLKLAKQQLNQHYYDLAVGCIDNTFCSQLLVMQNDIKDNLKTAFNIKDGAK